MFGELEFDVELKLEAEWTLEVEAEDHQLLHVVHIKLKLNQSDGIKMIIIIS